MHVKRRRPDDRWVQRTRDCPWLKTIVIINDQLLFFFTNSLHRKLIAELAERSPIKKLYKIVVTHQAEKIWMYDRTTDRTRCYF